MHQYSIIDKLMDKNFEIWRSVPIVLHEILLFLNFKILNTSVKYQHVCKCLKINYHETYL